MKKIVLPAVFISGITLGVGASEIANNGLFVFKSGDPIIASEVNANFEYLNTKIEEIKAFSVVTNKSFTCDGDQGGHGEFRLNGNKTIENNDIFPIGGPATNWDYSVKTGKFTLNTTPATLLSISYNYDEAHYVLRIVPENSALESFSCIY